MPLEGTNLTGTLSKEICSVSFFGSCPAFMDCSACSADMTSDYWELFGSACYIEPNDGCIKSHPEAGAFSGVEYDFDEVCTFKAKQSGILHVSLFDTEDGMIFDCFRCWVQWYLRARGCIY
jgi:hypothetical protein